MNATHDRRWLRFSLRTLFVVVTVLASWLGYELNWVRQRHQLLNRPDVLHWDQTTVVGVNLLVQLPKETPPRAPGLLWLFGETGIVELAWLIDESQFDESRSMDSYQEVQLARALFPEATLIEVYPRPSVSTGSPATDPFK